MKNSSFILLVCLFVFNFKRNEGFFRMAVLLAVFLR